MISPAENPDLYDKFTLATKLSPGVTKWSGHDHKINWDVKEGSGQSGASSTLKAVPLRNPVASISLADQEDLDAWPAFATLIKSTVSGTTPKALEIYHPDLAEHGITSVCEGQISGAQHDGKGGRIYVVTFQEYRPAKPKGGSPTGALTKPGTVANDPNAKAKAELAKLTKQYQDTPWG